VSYMWSLRELLPQKQRQKAGREFFGLAHGSVTLCDILLNLPAAWQGDASEPHVKHSCWMLLVVSASTVVGSVTACIILCSVSLRTCSLGAPSKAVHGLQL
jgi:hypothetical protein